MTFELFGFEWLRGERCYGLWVCMLRAWVPEGHRSLFLLHSEDGYVRFELFWTRIVGRD